MNFEVEDLIDEGVLEPFEGEQAFSYGSNDAGNAIFSDVDPLRNNKTLFVYAEPGVGNRGDFEVENDDELFITLKYGAVADDDFYADEDRADDAADYGYAGANDIVTGAGEGRLKILTDQIGEDKLVGMGGRSFSIRNVRGDLVWDSGDQLDRIAAMAGTYDDGRSDDKGVEPEDVEIASLKGRTFAFITLNGRVVVH